MDDIIKQYRELASRYERDLQDQIRKNTQIQTELNTLLVAYSDMRKESLAYQLERDRAVHETQRMERERDLAVSQRDELLKAETLSKSQKSQN